MSVSTRPTATLRSPCAQRRPPFVSASHPQVLHTYPAVHLDGGMTRPSSLGWRPCELICAQRHAVLHARLHVPRARHIFGNGTYHLICPAAHIRCTFSGRSPNSRGDVSGNACWPAYSEPGRKV